MPVGQETPTLEEDETTTEDDETTTEDEEDDEITTEDEDDEATTPCTQRTLYMLLAGGELKVISSMKEYIVQ